MLTIPRKLAEEKPFGDYRTACDYCGVAHYRSELKMDGAGLLSCFDEGSGKDVTTLARENALWGRRKPKARPRRGGRGCELVDNAAVTVNVRDLDPNAPTLVSTSEVNSEGAITKLLATFSKQTLGLSGRLRVFNEIGLVEARAGNEAALDGWTQRVTLRQPLGAGDFAASVLDDDTYSIGAKNPEEGTPTFTVDGSRMLILGGPNATLKELACPYPGSVRGATIIGNHTPAGIGGSYAVGAQMSDDGQYLFVFLHSGTFGFSRVLRYSMSTFGDLSTLSGIEQNVSLASIASMNGFSIKPDGTVILASDGSNRRVRAYSMTENDLTTLSATGSVLQLTDDGGLGAPFTSNRDGTKLYVGSGIFVNGTDNVYEYTLSTPWVPGSGSWTDSLVNQSRGNKTQGFALSPSQTRLVQCFAYTDTFTGNGILAEYMMPPGEGDYYVLVDDTAFQDLNEVAYAGLDDSETWSFSV